MYTLEDSQKSMEEYNKYQKLWLEQMNIEDEIDKNIFTFVWDFIFVGKRKRAEKLESYYFCKSLEVANNNIKSITDSIKEIIT